MQECCTFKSGIAAVVIAWIDKNAAQFYFALKAAYEIGVDKARQETFKEENTYSVQKRVTPVIIDCKKRETN